MFSRIGTNDLKSLKTFLDSPASGAAAQTNSIEYQYAVTPQIFAADTAGGVRQVNPNAVFSALGVNSSTASLTSSFGLGMTANTFAALPQDLDLVKGQYLLKAGHWPSHYDECVLVLTGSGGVSDFTLFTRLRTPTSFPATLLSSTTRRSTCRTSISARLGKVANTGQIEAGLTKALSAYMQQSLQKLLASLTGTLQTQLQLALQTTLTDMTSELTSSLTLDPSQLGKVFKFNMGASHITTLLMSMVHNKANSLESNLRQLGYADPTTPASIDIYPKDFASKHAVLNILDGYNQAMSVDGDAAKVITYTDVVGTLISSVTDIINKISAVLVAFVSISLVVSSIMIGVITYISVLERRKEIGVLRALGASKRDIGNVFNAETLIIGFAAGLMGVLITLIITSIANPIIGRLNNAHNVAQLPLVDAAALIGISMVLTLLAGLIPSSAASRRDPVEALRSE